MAKLRPDLTRATRKIESFMIDSCQILRDVEGSLDDVLDEDTGQLTRPVSDDTVIYSGKCLIIPTGVGSLEGSENQPVQVPGYRATTAYVPNSVTGVLENDLFVVTGAVRDPDMIGRQMLVQGVAHGTFAIGRRLELRDVR